MLKNKKRNYILLGICLLLFIASISTNFITINNAKERIIEEINNTPITEKIEKEEIPEIIEGAVEGETTETEEETNSYNILELSIVIISSIIAIISLLSIIITKFGSIPISESLSTSKRLIYYVICLVLLCSIIPTITVITSDKRILNGNETRDRDEKSIAIIEITNDEKYSSLKKESKDNDTSVIQVSNESNFIAENVEITKSAGVSSDKESSMYYGLNSAFIVKDASNSQLKESSIITNTNYATAFFVTGANSLATLNDVTIKTTKDYSNGISLSDTSEISAENINITTEGKNSHGIITVNEESSILITNSKINTSGINSSLLYSNGKIEATNIEGNSENSYIGTIEGKNSISLTDSALSTNAVGLDNNNSLSAAFLIYDKNSKNASANIGNASLTIDNSQISINKKTEYSKTSPIFYLTNSTAVINITNTKLSYESNILLKAEGNSLFGDEGDNGVDVTFTATDQILKGDIVLDELSKVRLHLNNSTFKGSLNSENKSKNVDITFDKKSYWILTDDSYINTLTIQNGKISRLKTNIDSNGYNIYYNANNNEWLDGRTIRLSGGGKMIPVFES